jgi:hypothetical protein
VSLVTVWVRGEHFVDETGALLRLVPLMVPDHPDAFEPFPGPLPEADLAPAIARAQHLAAYYHDE